MIIEGDAIREVLQLPDNSVHLFFFSPPYDNIRDDAPGVDYLTLLGRICYRKLVDGGIMAVVMHDSHQNGALTGTTCKFTYNLCYGPQSPGFRQWTDIVYNKDGKPGGWWNHYLRRDHEFVLPFLKGRKVRINNNKLLHIPAKHAGAKWHGTQTTSKGERIKITPKIQKPTKCRGTVWKYEPSKSEGNKIKLRHTATMPDLLARDCITLWTNEGELVVDPMAGSGTTGRMAKKLNRKWICVDRDPRAVDIMRELLE